MIKRFLLTMLILSTFLNANDTKESRILDVSLTVEEKAYLDSKPYLSVMSLENFQPFNFRTNNQPVGYSIDVVNLIGKYLHKDIKYIDKSWAEQLVMLKEGTLDFIPHMAITNERKDFVDYTDFIHLTFLIGFATHKDHTLNSMKDLDGKKLAVVEKSYIEDIIKKRFPKIKLYKVKNREDAIQSVAENKAYAVIDNIPTLNYFIQEKWLSNFKLVTLNDLGVPLETKMPMGVTKGNTLLKSILEKTYKTIPHTELKKLQQNWMNSEYSNINKNDLTNKEKTYLKKKKKILMCVLPNWLPFEQIDTNGNHKGIGADFMKIISKYLNTPVELVKTTQWSQSLQNIKERKCDILPVAMKIPSREESMNFTKPYVQEPFVIATKSDKFFIKDETELSNHKIGIVKSYAFIEVLKRKNPLIEIVSVENTQEGLEKVRSGELFGYIDAMPTIGYAIQKYSMLDLKIAGKLNFDIKLSIASRNDEPILNEIMQKALDSIDEDKRRTIIGHWISIKVAQEFDYSNLWKVSGVFLVILLIILYKNRAVRAINKKLILANKAIEEQQEMVDKYVLILTTDLKGIITSVNQAYLDATGFLRSDLIGNTHAIMKHPDMTKAFFDQMWITIQSNNFWNGEVKNLTKDNHFIWFSMNIEPIFIDNEKVGYRSISQNITDKKLIEKFSITDQLTQLYNRHYLEKYFAIEMHRSSRYETPLSLLLLDIDYFKLVNDTYGHDIGDETLKSMALILEKSVRKTDVVGRWGGEEFIIILPNTSVLQAEILAQKIRKKVEKYEFKTVGNKTVSIGISEYAINDTREMFVNKADGALYRAKKNGRNRVEIYS
ncbi:MAG: transporter substrate-binding domain-containing protein [Arcobacteraceae bacterium]